MGPRGEKSPTGCCATAAPSSPASTAPTSATAWWRSATVARNCGVVYCLSRNTVEEVAAMLAGHGIRALPYHAGLPAATRSTHLRRFLDEDGIVMVATIAF